MAYTTIKKPSSYFNTVLHTGNGSTQSITGVGFQPDFTWIKDRSGGNDHQILDSIRGETKALSSNRTDELTFTDGLTSFDNDGYTLGLNTRYNGSSTNYVGWNWLANGAGVSNTDGSITSTVSANTTSGFSIVSYTGIGSAATVGHGLGAVPKMIITKRRNGADSWSIYHAGIASDAETDTIYLEGTGAAFDNATFWNDTAPTSSVFSVGSASSANPFIAYCFADVQGFSKFGSYTGNGNANGTFVYTGFKPAFVMIKNSSSIGAWYMQDNKRDIDNPIALSLNASDSNADNNQGNIMDFLSNGIKIRNTGTGYNTSGNNYIYMAFAEEPLVGDNPATAR